MAVVGDLRAQAADVRLDRLGGAASRFDRLPERPSLRVELRHATLESRRGDGPPHGQAARSVGPAAGDDERDRVPVALGVVVRGRVAGGAVGRRERERRAQGPLLGGGVAGEGVALEDQLRRAVVGLRL